MRPLVAGRRSSAAVVEKTLRHIPFEFALPVMAGAILWLALGLWSNALNHISPKLTTPTTLGPAPDDYGVFHAAAGLLLLASVSALGLLLYHILAAGWTDAPSSYRATENLRES